MASLKAVAVVVCMLLAGLLICGAGSDDVAGQEERTAETCEQCKKDCNIGCANEASGRCQARCPNPNSGMPPVQGVDETSCDSCKNPILAQCGSGCPVKCLPKCPPPTAEQCSQCSQEKCVDGSCSGVAGSVCREQCKDGAATTDECETCKASDATSKAVNGCKTACFTGECFAKLGCPQPIPPQ